MQVFDLQHAYFQYFLFNMIHHGTVPGFKQAELNAYLSAEVVGVAGNLVFVELGHPSISGQYGEVRRKIGDCHLVAIPHASTAN